VPLYHPPRPGQRLARYRDVSLSAPQDGAPYTQPCRAGGAHPEDPLSRGHDPYRDVTPGVHAATRRAGSPSAVASDLKHPSLDWPATSLLLRRLRRSLPWRARAHRPRPVPSSFRARRSALMPPQLTTVTRPLPRRRPLSAGPGGIRVFAIDRDKPDTGTYRCQLLRMEHCPQWGGPLTIIAALVAPTVIAQILTHLGLPLRAPP
jgi:hypothetical protein